MTQHEWRFWAELRNAQLCIQNKREDLNLKTFLNNYSSQLAAKSADAFPSLTSTVQPQVIFRD